MLGAAELLATPTVPAMLPSLMEEEHQAAAAAAQLGQPCDDTPSKVNLHAVDPAVTLPSVTAAFDLAAVDALVSTGVSHDVVGPPAGGASTSLAMSPATAFAAATAVCRRLDAASWWWCSCYAVPTPWPRPAHTTARAYYLEYDDAMRERLDQRLRPPYTLACVRAARPREGATTAEAVEEREGEREATLESLQSQATEPPHEEDTAAAPEAAAFQDAHPPAADPRDAPFIREVPVPSADVQRQVDALRASLAVLEAQHAAQMMASCSATTDTTANAVLPLVLTLGQSNTGSSTTHVPAGAAKRVSASAPIDAGVTRGYASQDAAAHGSHPGSEDMPSAAAAWNGVPLSADAPPAALATPSEAAMARPPTAAVRQRPAPHDHDGPLPPPLSVLQPAASSTASASTGTHRSGEQALLSPVSATYADALQSSNRHGFVEGAGGRPITAMSDRGALLPVPSALSSSDRSAEVVTASQSPAWGAEGAIVLPSGGPQARMLDAYMWTVRAAPTVLLIEDPSGSPAPASGDPSRCSTAATGAGEGSLMMASAVSVPRQSLATSTVLGLASGGDTRRIEDAEDAEEAEEELEGAAEEPRGSRAAVPEGAASDVAEAVVAVAPAYDAVDGSSSCERDDLSSRHAAPGPTFESTVTSLPQDHSRATQPPGQSWSSERSSPEPAAVWVTLHPLVPSRVEGDGGSGPRWASSPRHHRGSAEAPGPLGTYEPAVPELEHTVEGEPGAGDAAAPEEDVSVEASTIAQAEEEAADASQCEAHSPGGVFAAAMAVAADSASSPWLPGLALATAASGERGGGDDEDGAAPPVAERRPTSGVTGRKRRSLSCDVVAVPEPHSHIYAKLNADLLNRLHSRGGGTAGNRASSATWQVAEKRADDYAPSSNRSFASSFAYTPHPHHLPRPAAPSPAFSPLKRRSLSGLSASSPAAPSSPPSQRAAAARTKAAGARTGSGSGSGSYNAAAPPPADADVSPAEADTVYTASHVSSPRHGPSASSPPRAASIPAPPGRVTPATVTLSTTVPEREREREAAAAQLPAQGAEAAAAAATETAVEGGAAPTDAAAASPSVTLPSLTRPAPAPRPSAAAAAPERAQSARASAVSVMPPVRRPSSSSRGFASTSVLTTGRVKGAAARADGVVMPLLRNTSYGGPTRLLCSPETSLAGLPMRPALSRPANPTSSHTHTTATSVEQSK